MLLTCPVNMLLDYVNCAGISLHEEKFIFRQICYCKSSNSYKLRTAGHISYKFQKTLETRRNLLIPILCKDLN
jgi:hypothetical protein